MKRGQITIFIVVGIIILATAAGILYYNQLTKTELIESTEPFKTDFFTSFIQNCLEKSTVEAIYHTFAQGGFYQFSTSMVQMVDFETTSFPPAVDVFEIEDEKLQVPVYFKDEKSQLPSLTLIEQETAKAAKENFLNCVEDFSSFKKEGYQIKRGEPKLEVRLAKNTVVQLEFPLKIISSESTAEFTTFSVVLPFDFEEKYTAISDYITQQITDPDYFLMGELSSSANEKDFEFGFQQFGEGGEKVLVDLNFDEGLKEEPIVYSFALYFDWPEYAEPEEIEIKEIKRIDPETLQEIENNPLILRRMLDWNITTPGIHTYQVEASGEELKYLVDPISLKIDQEGVITLDTNEFPNDRYLYYVIATNNLGQKVSGPLIINVNANDGSFPVIKSVEKQFATVGEEFYYQMETESDELVFFDTNSYLFDIDKQTGEITFTPLKGDEGIHSIRVDVENKFGRTWERWELEIE